LKDINTEIDAVEYELAQAMVDAECPNFTRGDRQFVLTMRTYWSAADGQKDALYDALKKQGHQEPRLGIWQAGPLLCVPDKI